MSKEVLLVAEALSNEKGVSQEVVFQAIQAALESATRKLIHEEAGVIVRLDHKTGEYETFRYWDVVPDDAVTCPEQQMTLQEAREHSSDIQIGERLEMPLPSIELGRIAVQAARQVIMQKVREAERALVVEQFQNKLGQLLYGVVKKVTKDNIIVDLNGKAEAFMPKSEILPNEMFRPNDKVRAYLYEIKPQPRGPQLFISRIHLKMLSELFRIEVPEVGENIIEIKAVARDPGNRSKIAVKTNDGRIDPIGACIGMRGARVQAVSNELKGERVDIILWDDNPAQLVINAMAPSEITSIVVDEEHHMMDLSVSPEQLSQAIGRNGQNVRLASQLSGWELNVMTIEEFEQKTKDESTRTIKLFMETLGIDETLATLLVEQGFSSIEEIAYIPTTELLAIPNFNETTAKTIQNKANDLLLTKALAQNQAASASIESLRHMEGMDQALFDALVAMNINSIDALAELSVDELMDIQNITEQRAAHMIMKARESWFK